MRLGCFVWVLERSLIRLALALLFLLLLLGFPFLLLLPVLLTEFRLRVHEGVDWARRVLLLLQHGEDQEQVKEAIPEGKGISR